MSVATYPIADQPATQNGCATTPHHRGKTRKSELPAGYVDAVKAALRGRESDVAADVCGVPRDLQDGRHHPCPLPGCPDNGGNDRFRAIAHDPLALFCNQCFNSKCHDVISLVMRVHCPGDFLGAVRIVGEYLRVPMQAVPAGRAATGKKKNADPAEHLVFEPWNEDLVAYWCSFKPPITPAAVQLCGGQLARYRDKYTVIALPVWGDHLKDAKPVGYALYNATGADLPVYHQGTEQVKCKLTAGSKPGIIGPVEQIAGSTVVWKTEGCTDLLALLSLELPPGHIAISNSNGCGEKPPTWWANLLADKTVYVIHDADQPGEKGAAKWAQALAVKAAECRQVRLPYPVEESHGKDLRDWIREGHSYADLLAMADCAQPIDKAARPTTAIMVDPEEPLAKVLAAITDCLIAAGCYYIRAAQLIEIVGGNLTPITSAPGLAGAVSQFREVYYATGNSGRYGPLSPPYANTWLNNRAEAERLPEIKLFTRNPVYDVDFQLVATGFNADSGIYYDGPTIAVREGTDHVDTLLREVCFKTPADRTNYLGILLTAILTPHFIGAKPAAMFNGNQPGLGKSILAQGVAIVRDGHPAQSVSYNPNDEEFEKRLGSVVRGGATTIIIDNAKSRSSRKPCIESACLERSITDSILSFRLLGRSEEIRAENSHIFCITANTPDVSRDLITRSVVINLYFEGDPEHRSFSIADLEGYAQTHRVEILGELIGMVERWKAAGMPKAAVSSRFNKRNWGTVVGGILSVCGEPDFLANAEDAATQLDETSRDFAELVAILADHPQGTWTASELVELCDRNRLLAADLGEGSPRATATRMGTLAGRYIGERFTLSGGRQAAFQRDEGRNGKIYRVFVRDSAEPAERCGTYQTTEGSAL